MARYYSEMMGRTAVYRVFADTDELLYVGVSRNPGGRIYSHSVRQPWGHLIHRVEVEWFATRDEAFTAEKVAIRDEDPIFNVSRPRVLVEA